MLESFSVSTIAQLALDVNSVPLVICSGLLGDLQAHYLIAIAVKRLGELEAIVQVGASESWKLIRK